MNWVADWRREKGDGGAACIHPLIFACLRLYTGKQGGRAA